MDIINTYTNNYQKADLVLIDQQSLDQNPAAVYLASLGSEASRRSQKQALGVISEMLIGSPDILGVKWAGLRFQHTQLIRNALAERYSYKTANKTLCALRKTLKAAWRLKQMRTDDYMRAADIEGVKGESIPAGRGLAIGEIAALMAICEDDSSPAGARDAAIIALAYSCGLRRDELVKLSLSDYDLLDSGADIAVVSKMAGHKSVVTTAGYDRRPEGQKIKAAGMLHVPYHGKRS